MRVLVAEDERITRAALARELRGWGHDVTAVEDGEAAWQTLREQPFDLVLTDWEMPRLSGVELIRRIRSDTTLSFVYIVMLTSRSARDDLVSGIEAGADEFLAKPFQRDELRVRLLAGERIVRLERTLTQKNQELQESARRIKFDLDAASRVQRAMLPRDGVHVPGTRTAWKYVPTDELAGDALGLQALEDGRLAAYVLDVSGHGVPAALLSVTAMHELGVSLDRFASADAPATLVNRLNQHFCSTDYDGRFMTMALCVLDAHRGTLHFSRAGHPPPILVREGQSLPLPDVGGMPLAVLADSPYDDAVITLAPGDRIYFYSDGMVEQTSPADEEFGLERLESLLIESQGSSLDVAVAEAVKALAGWSGTGRFTDDVSLLGIEYCGGVAGGAGAAAGGGAR
jgi:phosphoserine phosphatase RsbU/P